MFVDIHTHNSHPTGFLAVRNITLLEVESFLSSNEKGLFSVGFHPWFADAFSSDSFQKLDKYAADKRCVVIGECGLDKNCKVAFDTQILVFEKQISLSEKLKKPLIIHCVGHNNELFELKKALNPTQLWIIHGFRGKPQLAQQALNAGCALSFGERYNEESVRVTPLDKLFVETDESNLSIEDIYHQIAIIKECLPQDLDAGMKLLNQYLY
ncbi:MAG: TatD family hydrolase [Paludibacter sp.]